MAQQLDTRFFSVTPSSGDSLPQLDGLRAIAVIMILVRHSWGLSGAWQPVWRWGARIDFTPFVVMMSNGVDLFFVLSGFLLSRQFISSHNAGKPRPDVRRYFRLRAYRILPAYYFSLAAAVLIFTPSLIDPSLVYSMVGLKAIATSLFVMQTATPWAYGLWSATAPYWTLTIEILFYLALPYMVRLFFGRRWILAVPAFLFVTWGWLYVVHSVHADPLVHLIVDHGNRPGATPEFARYFLSKQLPAHLFDFACGIGAACAVAAVSELGDIRLRVARAARWLGTAVILTGMYALGRTSWDNSFYDGIVLETTYTQSARVFYYLEEPLMAFGFGLLIFGMCCAGARNTVLKRKPVRFFGVIGFGIYLFHMPLLYLYTKLPWIATMTNLRDRWFVLLGFTGVAVSLLASFTYLVIEKPFIDLARRRKPAAASGAVEPLQAGGAFPPQMRAAGDSDVH
ncbi:MAG: acyltransferase [Ilumatobacteraceae bacterium]